MKKQPKYLEELSLLHCCEKISGIVSKKQKEKGRVIGFLAKIKPAAGIHQDSTKLKNNEPWTGLNESAD